MNHILPILRFLKQGFLHCISAKCHFSTGFMAFLRMTYASEKQELERKISEGLADLQLRKERMNVLMEKIGRLEVLAGEIKKGRAKLKETLAHLEGTFINYGKIGILNDLKAGGKSNLREQNEILNERIRELMTGINSLETPTEIPEVEQRINRGAGLLQPEENGAEYLFKHLRGEE